jgi:hypothetical protein
MKIVKEDHLTRPESDAEADIWKQLAVDVTQTLENVGNRCLGLPAGTSIWSARGVAARITLRSNELLGATINLINLGSLAASRTLTRSLFECAFASAALTTRPDELVAMLKDDSEGSRRNQGRFILDRHLGSDDSQREALQQTIEAMDKRLRTVSPKKVAELGPIVNLYLQYQRLSDDSAHLTARSLEHYVVRGSDGWALVPSEANVAGTSATLRLALQSSLLAGLAVCEVLDFSTEEIGTLLQRLETMPPTDYI